MCSACKKIKYQYVVLNLARRTTGKFIYKTELSGDLHEQKHHEDQFFHNPDLYSQTYKKYSYSRRLIIHPTRSRSAISHRIPQLLFSRNHGTSSFLSPETDPVRAYLVVLGVLGEDGGGLLGWMKNPCESPPVRISHCLLLLGNVA